MSTDVRIQSLTPQDLHDVKELQPAGWSGVDEQFARYLAQDFCYPVKAVINGRLMAVGCSIHFGTTAWLAHILVGEKYRNKGLGYQITDFMVQQLQARQVKTILLIATELGQRVYKKLGFRTVAEYCFLKREEAWQPVLVSEKVLPLTDEFYPDLLQLDQSITGEKREPFLKRYLQGGMVYRNAQEVQGYYLPALGEGAILALTPEAGLELMKLKYATADKASFPCANQAALRFLENNGFRQINQPAPKMILGPEVPWKPECFYARVGGNYG